MDNFIIKLNLLKMSGAFKYGFKGKDGETHRCVCIPVDGKAIFEGQTGVYADLSALALRDPKYDDTHMIKERFPKADYALLTEEQRRNTPIIGSMRPRTAMSGTDGEGGNEAPNGYTTNNDEPLPF